MPEQEKQAVLIVDDQPNWQTLLSDILEEEYEVTSVGSYEDALRLIPGRYPPFAAAIIDIRLNDKDPQNEGGLKLFRRLRERNVPTSAIILTGYPSIRTAKEALQDLQAVDYVLKYPEDGTSFDLKSLRKTVRQAVELFVARHKDLPAPRTALIIEDEAQWQKTLADALDDYVTDCAIDFDEAVEKVQTQRYSLVIVDLKLGSRSPEQGMELLSRIRSFNEQAEVIVVSGYDTSERVRDAFAKYRVRDFLMKKHFSLQQFRSAIQRAEEEHFATQYATLSA